MNLYANVCACMCICICDSALVDILSSPLKDDKKVPILRPNITSTSTANNIFTQGNDTSVSFSQLVDESGNEVSPPVTS